MGELERSVGTHIGLAGMRRILAGSLRIYEARDHNHETHEKSFHTTRQAELRTGHYLLLRAYRPQASSVQFEQLVGVIFGLGR